MAYEKYIKRDGKLYGPYLYESKRVDGKVVSQYHGQKKNGIGSITDLGNGLPKGDGGKFFLIGLGVLAFILLVYFFAVSDRNLTGNAILNLDANYVEGQALDGKLKMSVQEGELIPSSSKVVVDNNGEISEFNLADLISEGEVVEGSFYIQNKGLSGSGEGYGLAGSRDIYPNVSFALSVLTPQETEESGIVETETEVVGMVSKDTEFKYQLEEGQRVEVVPRSVKIGEVILEDDVVEVEISNGEAVVSTDYTEKENGFGENYLGTKKKELNIDLSKMNFVPEEGTLKISIVGQEQKLISVSTNIAGEGEVNGEAQLEEGNTESNNSNTSIVVEEAITTETQISTEGENENFELTDEEKMVLTEEFGEVSVKTTAATSKNGFITVRYSLGSYWVEYSYDENLDSGALKTSMETDRNKWLKDIARTISEGKEASKKIGSLIVDYPLS